MSISEAIRVLDVSKGYSTSDGNREQVLSQVTFSVGRGELITLLGKSGCGKSTLLNIIGGFEKEDSGSVYFHGEPLKRPSRQCVMLLQNYGLLPWRTVLKNVELGLEETGLDAKQRKEQALRYIRLVGLEDRANHFPRQLSGGMQQRAAIARALALEPEIILMDEPFAALDTFTRYHLQDELLRIQSQAGTTIILVTHDIDEAVYLSDRILIMDASTGSISTEIHVQTSKPRDRGDGDFQHFRKRILEQFHFNGATWSEEYTI